MLKSATVLENCYRFLQVLKVENFVNIYDSYKSEYILLWMSTKNDIIESGKISTLVLTKGNIFQIASKQTNSS